MAISRSQMSQADAIRLAAVIATTLMVIAGAAGCTSDAKGGTCGFTDAYVTADDELYCPDPVAPDDCDALFDEIVEAAVRCANSAGIPVTEEELRAELARQDATPPCDEAVATTASYDVCLSELDDLTRCNDDGSLDPPESCTGAVLTAG